MPENNSTGTESCLVPPPAAAEDTSLSKAIISSATAKAGAPKTLATAANLANLLPTGTVLIFQALVPSFSNNGRCEPANQYLTLALIFFCSLACFLSSFTDSFYGSDNKLYYGIATFKGLYVFNDGRDDGLDLERNGDQVRALREYRLGLIDVVHAVSSAVLFLVVAVTSESVQRCYFRRPDRNTSQLIMNLPLAAGILASALFMLFPTRRRGIGFADTCPDGPKQTK